MLSKTLLRARLVSVTFLLWSCTSALPWHDAPPPNEVNLSFTMRNNLLFLPSATVDGLHGRYFFSTAAPHTVIDERVHRSVAAQPGAVFGMGDRGSVRIAPVVANLGGVGDAMIGRDVAGRKGITIDYRSGLLTFQDEGIVPAYMTLFRFDSEPMVNLTVAGRSVSAVIDTANPDTLILPSQANGRGRATVALAGTDFGAVDVRYAPVSVARVGNRILSKFLISIDYGRRIAGLWRDPRIP